VAIVEKQANKPPGPHKTGETCSGIVTKTGGGHWRHSPACSRCWHSELCRFPAMIFGLCCSGRPIPTIPSCDTI
jgi:hypothetical protein